jgi:AraC-like DNA-binding protein
MAQWSRASARNTMMTRANSLTTSAVLTESAANCRIYIDALERLGFGVDAFLDTAGIRRSELNDPDGRVPCGAIGIVLGLAQQQRRVTNLGMRIAMDTLIGAFPLLDYLILTSESAGHGLEQLSRYFRLVASPAAVQFDRTHDAIRVIYDGPPGSVQYEFGVALCLLHLREETNGLFRAESVAFAHAPDDPTEFERVLGCPVRSRAEWNGWTMTREAWELPFRRRDPILRGVLERQAAEMLSRLPVSGGLTHEVRQALISRVAGGDTRIEAVARALGVSVRSLQRRLAEEGRSYHGLVDETRKDAAERYLSNSPLSIGEVAFLLGYSEAAAFHRAFKRWSGATPQEFRRRCPSVGSAVP